MIRCFRWVLTLGLAACWLCSCAYASNTLTLSLEAPELGDSPKAVSGQTPLPKKTAPKPNTVTVGRVGMVQVSSASIFRSKSYRGRKLAVVKAETPVAIVKEEGAWYGILMNNGAIGWIPAKSVRLTTYELVAKSNPQSRTNLTSRGGLVNRGETWTDRIIRQAMQYSGVRYVFGGTDPNAGMDCSAFVRMIFGQFSINLPRTAREQAEVGSAVPFDQLQPGDRLYFACRNPYIDHCGIYAGNGYFVHCSSSRNGVGVDALTSNFYGRSLVVARRS
ncbi:MAG: C40 family peptidase [Armatimonadetes bacterium]|nr:C40 family peptidase [Armatimonadota bacterium]